MSAFCFVNKIAGIIFGPVRKSVRNGKKISACLKKVMHWAETSHLEKQNQISRSNLVTISLEPSLTVDAVVEETFAYVLFLL